MPGDVSRLKEHLRQASHEAQYIDQKRTPPETRAEIGNLLVNLRKWSPVSQRYHPAEFLPDFIVSAYEILYVETYGSDAQYLGDPNALSHLPLRAPLNSNQNQTRGVAVQKKKLSSSQRSPLKNERAFRIKQKYDRKLRKVMRELKTELADREAPPQPRCSRCARLGDGDWMYCPACGHRMEYDATD